MHVAPGFGSRAQINQRQVFGGGSQGSPVWPDQPEPGLPWGPGVAPGQILRAKGELALKPASIERRRVATGANHPASHTSALRRGPGTPASVPQRGTRAPVCMLHRTTPMCVKTGLEANLLITHGWSEAAGLADLLRPLHDLLARYDETRRGCPACRIRRRPGGHAPQGAAPSGCARKARGQIGRGQGAWRP
jgi:hypothetical protein